MELLHARCVRPHSDLIVATTVFPRDWRKSMKCIIASLVAMATNVNFISVKNVTLWISMTMGIVMISVIYAVGAIVLYATMGVNARISHTISFNIIIIK